MRTLRNWHIILGHTDPRNILQLHSKNLAKGLEITKTNTIGLDPHFDCIGCSQGKAHVWPFGNTHIETPQQIGDIIYSDVWGPASKLYLQGKKYYIVFVDAATWFMFVHFMQHKNEAVDRYIALANFIHTQKGKEIKRIHFDNGKELINKHLCEYCDKMGTEITTTAPYSSQQNGPTEHAHQTLAECTWAMIHGHSNTHRKTYLWQEVIIYTCMISNNMPHKIRGEWHSPQIEMYSKLINLSYFQLFSSTCHVLIQKEGLSKLEAKTKKAIFTGIDHNSGGAWRYLVLLDWAIWRSQNVFFPQHLPDPSSSDEPCYEY
jgi:hypothetical protein